MKKLLITLVSILCIFAVAFDIGYIYIKYINKDSFNKTYNLSTFDGDPEKYFFDFNYYKNTENDGIEMLELKFSCYTGVNLETLYSYGVQILNPSKVKYNETQVYKDVNFWNDDVYLTYSCDYSNSVVNYFNDYDGLSYVATNGLNERKAPYIVTIDDKMYSLDFNKEFITINKNFFQWTYYNHHTSNFEYFMSRVNSGISSFEEEGVFYNVLFDFENVFNFYTYDSVSQKFVADPDYVFDSTFLSSKVTYHNRGAKIHEDSMFGQIILEKGE